ncbi:MAG: hypothetical protein WBC73_16880, partial [Phormidesmis sp.]
AYCAEKDLASYARYRQFPLIPCTLCGSQANLQRATIKQMLHDWEKQWPGRTETLFRSLQNVAPSQLADASLFDFAALEAARQMPENRSEGQREDNRKAKWEERSDSELVVDPLKFDAIL